MYSRSFSRTGRTIFPGTPITIIPSGTFSPGGTTAPAATKHSFPSFVSPSSVPDRPLPAHAVPADHVRPAGVAVDDHPVLHVRPPADRDRRDVPAHDRVEPERAQLADRDVPGDDRVSSLEVVPGRLGEQV